MKSYACFLDDLRRCAALGIQLYNFHPGNTVGAPRPEAIARIAAALNRAHKAVPAVKPLLENMAGANNVIGSSFEDLRDIIALVEDKSRVGVCLDTCHAFAAGHDLRSGEKFGETLERFERVVGMRYLCALHLNDSKAPFASHRDLHANIGTGFLGLRAFWNVMNEKRFEGLPMVLETPIDEESKDEVTGKPVEDKGVWAREIKLLESLIGMDVEGEEFKALEEGLAKKGESAREKMLEAVRKKEMTEKEKGKGRGKRKKAETTDEEGSASE